MSLALEMCFGIPLFIGYIISSLVVIPLVTHGITLISRFQAWTQPFWLFLHLLPFVFIAFYAPRSFEEWTQFRGTAETQRDDIQPPPVRHRLDGRVLADRADRRAGRLPALPAGARRKAKLALVGRLSVGRTGLDRARRAQDAGGLVPGVPRDPAPGSAREGGRADADVSRRVPVRLFLAAARARIHRRLRHHLAAQDQRHQRLCRLDRVVELLLAADPQPSGPRRLAGLQCRRSRCC